MNQRMKWDAEAAFKRDEIRLSLSAAQKRDGNGQICKEDLRRRIEAMGDGWRLDVRHKFGWTPAPERLAQLRKYEPPAKHGRDIGSLMRYHEAHKKGRTDDDCLREKFGGSGDVRRATDTNPGGAASGSLDRGCSAAPTPPQSTDGGQPLPSASTKPHGKDVDTADGPWPKCTKMAHSEEYHLWRTETEGIWFNSAGLKGVCGTPSFTCAMTECNRIEVSRAEMAGFLEAHGHKDVAAQLRGKAINSLSIPTKLIGEEFEPVGTMPVVGDKVEGGPNGTIGTVTNVMLGAVGEGNVEIDNGDANRFLDRFTGEDACGEGILRILKRPVADNAIPRADVATGGGRVWEDGGFAWVQIGGVMYGRVPAGLFVECVSSLVNYMRPEWEKLGHERDAILSECRKAMGL